MIFEEQVARKPDHYPWAKEFYDTMHNGFWTSGLFKFQSDIHDFKTRLSPQEQEVVAKTLSAIGQIEIAVKTFWGKLGDTLPHPSLRDLGYVMANVEVIHNDAYEKLLTVLGIKDIFEENLKLPVINGRVNYLRKYLHRYSENTRQQFVYSIILFTLFVENVSLFSQFYIINWFFKFKNVLKDTDQQVKYTRQEENIHAKVGIRIIKQIREEHPELFDKTLEERVQKEAIDGLAAETKIIEWMIGDYSAENLTKDVLIELVKVRINDSFKEAGFQKPFKIDKKLAEKSKWFEVECSANISTDFFHQKPIEYGKIKAITLQDLFDDERE